MLRQRDLTYDERKLIKQKIDQKQRRKLKITRGKQVNKPRPKTLKNLPYVAFEYSGGDPLGALTAAVEAINLTK